MKLAVVAMETSDSRTTRYQLSSGQRLMTWREVLHGWAESSEFIDDYSAVLMANSPRAFRWETPCLQPEGLDETFEFVLVQASGLERASDPTDFEEHFWADDSVVTFSNLRGDCVLVVPQPVTLQDDFAHLGAFLRSASREQVRDVWRATATAVFERLTSGPLWLSTAGAGVPWLHIRLDDRPKYYAYAPYRRSVS